MESPDDEQANDRARQRWRNDGKSCVADGHKPKPTADQAICTACGQSAPVCECQ
jgi:hypothetical protein